MSAKLVLALISLAVAVRATQRQWTNLKGDKFENTMILINDFNRKFCKFIYAVQFAVHFDVNPFSKYTYQSMPRQLSEMRSNWWTSLSGNDCTNGGKFNGFRYMDTGEAGMALLFDVQGTIAGIQQIVRSYLHSNQMTIISKLILEY